MARVINLLAELVEEHCTGCSICERVCPTIAITMVKNAPGAKPAKLPVIDADACVGCWSCEQRCPEEGALRMIRHTKPSRVEVSVDDVDYSQVQAICRKAHLHPEQVVCFCTLTRAEEVVAGILKGYTTPEQLSYQTGIRTGCKVECTQPLLRLLDAAGYPLQPIAKGWQLMGKTITAWEIPAAVKAKYDSRGFYFDEDIKILDEVVNAVTRKEE
jgi:NAD-dependent dihydropyrimidine dehydrogenase PreA subunit